MFREGGRGEARGLRRTDTRYNGRRGTVFPAADRDGRDVHRSQIPAVFDEPGGDLVQFHVAVPEGADEDPERPVRGR
ncbi:hypothetical protein [Amycolatopsis sp. NPDC051102]|uniref:hypothetical protein n=1 Tax=Amycolatopsis sp. NPDC051102 TaxID=3155163 RepID=UPI003443B015